VAQQKPEETILDQVLRLAVKLPPEELDIVVEELNKLQNLRKKLQESEEDLAAGRVHSIDEVFDVVLKDIEEIRRRKTGD